MRIDTSRDSYQSGRHYRQVLQRQGQVLLDADWNEQQRINDHLRHRALHDVIGDSGGPMGAAAFELHFAGADVTVGAGRYYVDGILVENDVDVALDSQPHAPAGTPLFIDANGDDLGAPIAGVYLAELDVWTRLVTALDDPKLREIAVPVPDTSSRGQTVWQVRMLRVAPSGNALACGNPLPVWTNLRRRTTGRMRARAEPGDDSTTPCEIPAGAGYRGPDNQHYRVEIRAGGNADDATFVWSREHGSVQGRWLGQSGDELTVSVPSRGPALGFGPDDWIELVDDRIEAAGEFGPMVQIATVNDDVIAMRAATATDAIDFSVAGPNPKIRRWEAPPQPLGTGFVSLERGVEVEFDATGTYATGQWWNVVARTALNDIIWPGPASAPVFVDPEGPTHRYARLALADFDGATWTLLDDCRAIVPPLTAMITLGYAGGDGQTAAPDPTNPSTLVPLAEELMVSVTNGNVGIQAKTVEFAVIGGNGRVEAAGALASSVTVVTDADGMARVRFHVDSTTASQTVRARIIEPDGPRDAAILFHASLLHAGGVTLLPGACPELAGAQTVQDAIATLCQTNGDGCATIVLTPAGDWSAPLRDLRPGDSVRICFRPGVYQLREPVVIVGVQDVLMDGAGTGSHINGERLETLFRFEGCDRVRINDLRFSSRLTIHPGPTPGRGGALTAIECGSIDVERVRIEGAAGQRRSAACLTVIGASSGTRVSVIGCHLRPGHLQDGIIVINGRHVRIRDNVIETAKKPSGLSFENLLQDRERQRRLVGRLVGNPQDMSSGAVVGEGIQLGDFTVTFSSVVDRSAWTAQVRNAPPSDADLRDEQSVQKYVQDIADNAISDADSFPAFKDWMNDLRTTVGHAQVEGLLDDPIGARSIKASLLGTVAVTARSEQVRTVTVQRGIGRVRFRSPVLARDWIQALNVVGVSSNLSSAALRRALYAVAEDAIADAPVRNRVPAFAEWFDVLRSRNMAAAWNGVVCAGPMAEDIVIEANSIRNVIEAIRVAPSHSASMIEPPDRAGSVRIAANECVHALPFELARGQQSIFVGNAQRTVISANSCSVLGTAQGATAYENGIHVDGHLGPELMVRENVVDHVETGVRVRSRSGSAEPHRWAVRDNVAPAAPHAARVSPSVVVSDNVGR